MDAGQELSVVSRPRNQRCLQPVTLRRDGLLAVRRQRQNPGQIAHQLDLQPAVLRDQANLVDKSAEHLGGFATQFGPVQLLMQSLDPLPVELGELADRYGEHP